MAPEEKSKGAEDVSTTYRYRLPLGEGLAHYRILRPLGVSELGETYLAEEITTRKRCVLRVFSEDLAADPGLLAQLREMVAQHAKLKHPNIRGLEEAGTDRGLVYLAMDHLEGPQGDPRTLLDELREGGGRIRSEARIQHITLKICEALEKAHAGGVVHGYLHPSDVLIGSADAARAVHRRKKSDAGLRGENLNRLIVQVSDFGMHPLRERSSRGWRADVYTSPEEKAGTLTPQTDLYAAGVILYQMLTGGRPGSPFVPPSRFGISKVWDPITEKCLQPDPSHRYTNARALKREVAKAVVRRQARVGLYVTVGVIAAAVTLWQGTVIWKRAQAEMQRRAEERRLMEQRKADAEALVREAREAFELRKLAEADVLVRRALDLISDQPEALKLQGEIERASDMGQASIARADCLQKLEKLRAIATEEVQKNALKKVEEFFQQAEQDWTRADYAAARDHFRAAVAECEGALKLGEERLSAMRFKLRAEQARWNARKHSAEQEAPRSWADAQDLLNRALAAFAEGKYADASRDFQAAAGAYNRAQLVGMEAEARRAQEARTQRVREDERLARARWPRLPEGFRVLGEQVDPASGLPRVIEHSRTGYRMVLIPAGPFPFGSPLGVGYDTEHPQRTIFLDEYWIGETEVTVEQYNFFLTEMGNQTEGGVTWANLGTAIKLGMVAGQFVPDAGFETHPVVEVSWYGARAFADWIGGDLPTEIQWEKAAKGGRDTRWPWGDRWDKNMANTAERLAQRANFQSEAEWLAWWEPFQKIFLAKTEGAYQTTTQPVRTYLDNPYGLFDMAGNVFEWCLDYYLPYRAHKLANGQKDPPPILEGTQETVTYWRAGEKLTETAECRVVRGGSWGYPADYARTSFRFKALSVGRYSDVGFRVVVVPKPMSTRTAPTR